MKWVGPLTRARQRRYGRAERYKPWFAWRPVRVNYLYDDMLTPPIWVWLETVERCRLSGGSLWFGEFDCDNVDRKPSGRTLFQFIYQAFRRYAYREIMEGR